MSDETTPEQMDELFGRHMDAEMNADLMMTLETMSDDPHIFNGPTMINGRGVDGVRAFYTEKLIGQFFPPDVTFTTVSRTHGVDPTGGRARHRVHPHHVDRLDASRHRPDRATGLGDLRGHRGGDRRQGRLRAHLLGPGIGPRPTRADRRERTAGSGGRGHRSATRHHRHRLTPRRFSQRWTVPTTAKVRASRFSWRDSGRAPSRSTRWSAGDERMAPARSREAFDAVVPSTAGNFVAYRTVPFCLDP